MVGLLALSNKIGNLGFFFVISFHVSKYYFSHISGFICPYIGFIICLSIIRIISLIK